VAGAIPRTAAAGFFWLESPFRLCGLSSRLRRRIRDDGKGVVEGGPARRTREIDSRVAMPFDRFIARWSARGDAEPSEQDSFLNGAGGTSIGRGKATQGAATP
jgi:hypothetical protein